MITLEDLYEVEDPLRLFELSTQAISEHQHVIDRLASIRTRAAAALHAQGYSYKDLSRTLGVSAPRVGQLVSANDAPDMGVIRAWITLEQLLSEVVQTAGRPSREATSSTAINILRQSHGFDQDALMDLEFIRKMRNDVVHGRISVSEHTADIVSNKAEYLKALIVLWLSRETGRSSHEGLRQLDPLTETPRSRGSRFEIYRDANGQFRFRLLASNSEVLVVGEAYESKAGALSAINVLRGTASTAVIDDMGGQTRQSDRRTTSSGSKFELYKDSAGRYRFRITAASGEVVAVGELFETKASALQAIDRVRRAAASVPLNDAS